MRALSPLGLLFAALFISGHAFACNVPNPNLTAPAHNAFVDGCPIPAAALNNIYAKVSQSPMLYGAVGNGVADDTAAVKATITAAQAKGVPVWLGDGVYGVSSTITDNGTNLLLMGNGGPGYKGTACTSGLRQITANLAPMISLSGPGSALEKVCIDNGSVSNTTGADVFIGTTTGGKVLNSTIIGACGGVDATGNGSVQNVGTVLTGNSISLIDSAGCFGFRVGHNTTNANTTETHITDNEIFCPGTTNNTIGMEFEDSGGAYVANNGIVPCAYGTRIYPASSQEVQGAQFVNTVMGDTSTNNDFLVDAASSSGIVKDVLVTGSWMASAFSTSVLIQDTPNALIAGIHFTGDQIYPRNTEIGWYLNGASSSGLSDVTMDGGAVCVANAGTTSPAAVISDTGGFAAVRNVSIGICGGADNTVNTGVGLSIAPSGEATSGVYTDNLIHGMSTYIAYNGLPSSNVIIKDNGVWDSFVPTVASATTVTSLSSTFIMSGTATLSNLLPAWVGRQVTILPTAAWGTTTGGNIGTVGAATAGTPVTAIYNGSNWNFHF